MPFIIQQTLQMFKFINLPKTPSTPPKLNSVLTIFFQLNGPFLLPRFYSLEVRRKGPSGFAAWPDFQEKHT